MIKNNLTQNWNNFKFDVNSKVISEATIVKSIRTFQKVIIKTNQNMDSKIAVLFKVITQSNQIRTIGPLQITDLNSFKELENIFTIFWSLKSEEYYISPYTHIIFQYKFLDKNTDIKLNKKIDGLNNFDQEKKEDFIKFGGYNLPQTMDFTLWGRSHYLEEDHTIV